jgi:hypothetical protein
MARTRRASKQPTRTYDAFPDRIDLRDWPYQPMLRSLPDTLVNCSRVPEILDQGREGACTGFALAAVVNYLLGQRGIKRAVSPRMLYEMARCYDEWPGEAYDGSSARGAMKGWARHGVCERTLWGDAKLGRGYLDARIAESALDAPAGAYYRIRHQEVRDVHAALGEVGIVYCTIMVHQGWADPQGKPVRVKDRTKTRTLPVIDRAGRATDGHAIALVGYTRDGFIVQNSWGPKWGSGGFALLPYEDFLLHATDVWVAQLGVPLTVDLWASTSAKAADTTSGLHRGTREIPLAEIRPFIVDVGNNGELSETGDYWTSKEDLERLFTETIPKEATDRHWTKKRVMLYLHGGLNSESDAAKRVVAFRDKCLKNGVYPLHLMWETGPLETIADVIGDLFAHADRRAGGSLLEGFADAKNRVLELTASPIGGPMWSEMKENAWRAADHRDKKGAIQLMQEYALASLAQVSDAERQKWELHVVAHSAGSILFAHAVEALCSLGIAFKTLQMFAPAIRIDEFERAALPAIKEGRCPKATLYILTDDQESRDTVGPYGHSLLYLVSNAFEDKRETPLLGMERYLERRPALRKAAVGELALSKGEARDERAPRADCRSETHGGFDNDPATMNSVLTRILGRKPVPEFNARDLDY